MPSSTGNGSYLQQRLLPLPSSPSLPRLYIIALTAPHSSAPYQPTHTHTHTLLNQCTYHHTQTYPTHLPHTHPHLHTYTHTLTHLHTEDTHTSPIPPAIILYSRNLNFNAASNSVVLGRNASTISRAALATDTVNNWSVLCTGGAGARSMADTMSGPPAPKNAPWGGHGCGGCETMCGCGRVYWDKNMY